MSKPFQELIIFSDLHAHNFKYGSKRIPYKYHPGMYNSRLVDTLNVLDEIHQYAKENNIFSILFGGDLFHVRGIQHTDVYNMIARKLKKITLRDEIKVIAIPGNHDFADKAGNIHSLQSLENPNLVIMDSPRAELAYDYSDDTVHIIGVPYTDNRETAKIYLQKAADLAKEENKYGPCILLAHLGMQGAKVGSDYVLVSDNDIGVSDVPTDDFIGCFFGHFHEHQKLFKNGWYIGATHQHNWGDENGSRGFLHVKVYTDHVEFKQIETKAPKFITLCDGMETTVRDVDFTRTSLNALDVRVRSIEEMEKLDEAKLDPYKALEAWVDIHHEVDRDMFIGKGKEIFNKVNYET